MYTARFFYGWQVSDRSEKTDELLKQNAKESFSFPPINHGQRLRISYQRRDESVDDKIEMNLMLFC
jgi:hypothetical protein